jgi:hypothetical protein
MNRGPKEEGKAGQDNEQPPGGPGSACLQHIQISTAVQGTLYWRNLDRSNSDKGTDLRKAPKTDRYEFGFLPPRLFNQVRDAFVAFHKTGQTKTTSRT